MRNDTPAPVDTIELLLREIATQLRQRTTDNRGAPRTALRMTAALLVATTLGCDAPASEAPVPEPEHRVAVAPSTSSASGAADRRAEVSALTRAAHVATVYVERTTGCHDDPHDSTAGDPYCEIAPALPPSGQVVVKLAASDQPYSPIELDGAAPLRVTVIGPGSGLARIVSPTGVAVRMRGQQGHDVELALHDVSITGGPGRHGVDCGGKSGHAILRLEGVALVGSGGAGLFAYGCDVTLRHALVDGNGAGLIIAAGRYTLEDVALTGNQGGKLVLVDADGTQEGVTWAP